MIRNSPALFLLCALLFSCSKSNDTASFRERVIQRLDSTKGEFGIAFHDLQTDEMVLIHEHDLFHAASTMKTPVMVETYRQASKGKFSLEDSITIKNEFRSIVDGSTYSLDSTEDSEQELYRVVGEKRRLYDVMYAMIIASSNLATNLIIDLVNADSVTATMRQLGLKDLVVLRGVEDDKAYRQGLNNKVTAYDLMLLFSGIAKGELVSQQASDEMIKILLDQKFNDIIPAKLPKEVRVAHKTGWITGVHHDSAIVFLPDGRKYVLVLLSKGLTDEKAGVEALADVSKLFYERMMKKAD